MTSWLSRTMTTPLPLSSLNREPRLSGSVHVESGSKKNIADGEGIDVEIDAVLAADARHGVGRPDQLRVGQGEIAVLAQVVGDETGRAWIAAGELIASERTTRWMPVLRPPATCCRHRYRACAFRISL